MDLKRAQEIFESKGVIDVNYNGMPIWIKTINHEEGTIEIKGLQEGLKDTVVDPVELSED